MQKRKGIRTLVGRENRETDERRRGWVGGVFMEGFLLTFRRGDVGGSYAELLTAG